MYVINREKDESNVTEQTRRDFIQQSTGAMAAMALTPSLAFAAGFRPAQEVVRQSEL